jgi:hypothetical protein
VVALHFGFNTFGHERPVVKPDGLLG